MQRGIYLRRVFLIILAITIFLISGCSSVSGSLISKNLTQEQQEALERLDPNELMNLEIFNLTEDDVLQIDGIKTTISPPYQPIQEYYGVKEGRIWYFMQSNKIQKGRLLAIQYFIQVDNETERLQKCAEIVTDIITILGDPDKTTLGNQTFSNQPVSFDDLYALLNTEDWQNIRYQWEDEDESLYVETTINSTITSIGVDYGWDEMII